MSHPLLFSESGKRLYPAVFPDSPLQQGHPEVQSQFQQAAADQSQSW